MLAGTLSSIQAVSTTNYELITHNCFSSRPLPSVVRDRRDRREKILVIVFDLLAEKAATRSSCIALRRVNNSDDAIFQQSVIEVNQQPQRFVAELQVGEKLLLVYGFDYVNGLHLNYYGILHQKVHSKSVIGYLVAR